MSFVYWPLSRSALRVASADGGGVPDEGGMGAVLRRQDDLDAVVAVVLDRFAQFGPHFVPNQCEAGGEQQFLCLGHGQKEGPTPPSSGTPLPSERERGQ